MQNWMAIGAVGQGVFLNALSISSILGGYKAIIPKVLPPVKLTIVPS